MTCMLAYPTEEALNQNSRPHCGFQGLNKPGSWAAGASGKSTSDGQLLSRGPSLWASEVKREASPEDRYRKFVGKIRAKQLS